MQAIHDLLNRGVPVPPVHVQNVDVRSPQLLQAGIYADVHRLDVVTGIHEFLAHIVIATLEICGVLEYMSMSMSKLIFILILCHLCSNHELVANASLLCPQSDKFFGALILAERLEDLLGTRDRVCSTIRTSYWRYQ